MASIVKKITASIVKNNAAEAFAFMESNPEYTFLTQNLDTKKFHVWKRAGDIGGQDLHLTEYIREHEPRRFYVDWEDYYEPGSFSPERCGELLSNFEDFKTSFSGLAGGISSIQRMLGHTEEAPVHVYPTANIRDYEWRGKVWQKVSVHLVFYGVYFANWADMKRFVEQALTNVKESFPARMEGEGFDTGVYSKNQGLRMKGQTKNSKDKLSALETFPEFEAGFIADVKIPGLIKPTEAEARIEYEVVLAAEPKPETTAYARTGDADEALVALLHATHKKHFDNYTDWIRIGYCCFNEGIPLEEYVEASKVSVHWQEGSPRYIAGVWDGFKESTAVQKVSQGTLWQWLKDDDPAKFTELRTKRSDFMKFVDKYNEQDCATFYWNAHPHEFVFNETMGWFALEKKNTWRSYGLKYPSTMKTRISTALQQEAQTEIDILNVKKAKAVAGADEETRKNVIAGFDKQIKVLCAAYKSFGTSTYINGVMSFIKDYYVNHDLPELMNQNTDLFAFSDKVYHTPTGVFRDIRPDDWVSTHTGYPAPTTADETATREVEELFYGLFENRETSLWLQRVLASCIIGRNRWEQFYVLTGTGANGKGMIAELLRRIYGEYYNSVDVSLFTQVNKSKDPAMPVLVNARYSRVMLTSESESDDKLQVGFLKKMSGNDIIEARLCHGNDMVKYTPQFITFIMLNNVPQVSEVDPAIQRRMRVLNLPFKFVDRPTDRDHRKGDPDVKDVKCRSVAWRDATILMFLRLATEMRTWGSLPDCPAVAETTKEYLESCDPLREWLSGGYEITRDPEDKIKSSVLFNDFKLQNRDSPIGNVKFANLLKNNGLEKKRSNGMWWLGIRLKSLPEPEPESVFGGEGTCGVSEECFLEAEE